MGGGCEAETEGFKPELPICKDPAAPTQGNQMGAGRGQESPGHQG